jgi:hypothetical protein
MSRPREEWLHNIGSRYRALENFTQEDARLQFLRILRSLPYGMHELRLLSIYIRLFQPSPWCDHYSYPGIFMRNCRQFCILLCEAH